MGNQQIHLVSHPQAQLRPEDFATTEAPMPGVGAGQVLCRTILLSIDPSNRAWMQGRTYRERLDAGQVMRGLSLCEVVDERGTDIPIGTLVLTEEGGWQQFAAVNHSDVRPLRQKAPLTHHMSVLGLNGLTAYFGLVEIGQPRPGECVLVSAAAGATGGVVGQLAKRMGARTVGIAGSDAKVRHLTEVLGFDAAVSHRSPDLVDQLHRACPDGIDVYFDNVGGDLLDTALALANVGGRVVCCGAVSQYDLARPGPGPRRVPGMLITKRLTMKGFITSDHTERYEEVEALLADWLTAGELRAIEEVHDGLGSAPAALIGLLAGENVGKVIVRVGDDPRGGIA